MTTHQKDDPVGLTWADVKTIQDWLDDALLQMDKEIDADHKLEATNYSAFNHFDSATRQQSLTELVEALHLNHVVEERVS
jgi:hypothetical protein